MAVIPVLGFRFEVAHRDELTHLSCGDRRGLSAKPPISGLSAHPLAVGPLTIHYSVVLGCGVTSGGAPSLCPVSQAFDPQEMIERFRERADAVKRRGLPPVEGPERLRFMEAAKLDFQDFAMLGDATATLNDGILRLEIDLRPPTS
jgi:hypothetical protein